MECHIEIHLDGRWLRAATFEPQERGLARGTDGGCRLEYEPEYALAHLEDRRYELAPEVPVNFAYYRLPHWPPFLLDLLPGGHARRRWLDRLNLPDTPASDYELLLKGGANPPGNLRIGEAVREPVCGRRGFTFQEVAERQEGFLDYAEEMGALVSGASSVQGEAPKFLLVWDQAGAFHPEGALADEAIAEFWLVKYPRGRHSSDAMILHAEAAYYRLACWFGVRVGAPLVYVAEGPGALFIPRFDRVVTTKGVQRLGMMTLAALTGAYRFGQRSHHEAYCEAIARHSRQPVEDLGEYLARDLLNLALGNTDNHGRNSVLLKDPEGRAALAPLFDFAPMFLDREGIARATRWAREPPGGPVDWAQVTAWLGRLVPGSYESVLLEAKEKLRRLPAVLKDEELGVDAKLAERCVPRIEALLQSLGG